MIERALRGLVSLAVLLAPIDALALRVAIHDDPTGAPGSHSTLQMIAVLQTAFREYEAHSEGHVTFDGPFVTTAAPKGPGNLQVFWDRSLSACAFAITACGTSDLQCSIALNPMFFDSPTTPPRRDLRCRSACSILLHEFAHHVDQYACGGWHLEWVRDRKVWFDNCHGASTVLGYVFAAGSVGLRSHGRA